MADDSAPREYVLKLDTYSIGTLPMNRLAGFVSDLATIMGEYKSVHLCRVDAGSVAVRVTVDAEADARVRERLHDAKGNAGPPEARRAMQSINQSLAEDNATATLIDAAENRLLTFAGAGRMPVVGPIRQAGTLDGIPIRVGGRRHRVPVHLDRFGHEVYVCLASREIAQQIAKLLFDTPIRVEGIGTWYRWPDGAWELDGFVIHSFDAIDEPDLKATVERLRAIELPLEPDEDLLDTMAEIRNGS